MTYLTTDQLFGMAALYLIVRFVLRFAFYAYKHGLEGSISDLFLAVL